MNPSASEKGGRFQKDLSLILDAVLRAPSRRMQTTDEAVVALVERVRRDEVRTALKQALSFCYQFNKRAGLSVERSKVIAPLGNFIEAFNQRLPADGRTASSWVQFTEFIRKDLAAKKANRMLRHWMRLPPRLFRSAHSLAETEKSYRDRQAGLPRWSVYVPTASAGAKIVPCWLKERDHHPSWKQHCWSGCGLCFLKRCEFTEKELESALDCRTGARREQYCSGDRRKPDSKSGGDVDKGSPDSRREERDDEGGDLEAEAEAFANAQTHDENLSNLVRDLVVEPRKRSVEQMGFGWRDLFPGVQYAAVALAFLLSVGIAVVALKRGESGTLVVASLVNDGLRSGPTTAPTFLKDLPKELEASMDLRRGTIRLATQAGDRIDLTGVLTNSAASGGRLWIGRPTVQGKTRTGVDVGGSALVRIRTRNLVELQKAQLPDLEWISVELELSSGGQTGTVSLVFGTP